MSSWHAHPITTRQRIAIQLIEEMLDIPFDGRTKGAASAFIGSHYDDAKEVRRTRRRVNPQRVCNAEVAKRILEEAAPW